MIWIREKVTIVCVPRTIKSEKGKLVSDSNYNCEHSSKMMLNSPAAAANMYPWYRGGAASAGDPAAAAAAASAMSQLGPFCGAANKKTENGNGGGGGGGGGSLGAAVGGGGGSHAAAAAAAADCGMLALDYAAHNKVGKLNEHQIFRVAFPTNSALALIWEIECLPLDLSPLLSAPSTS